MTYRQRANLILGLSFVAFIAIFFWWYTHDVSVWEELLFFVIQSALIGSIADWFAVTALFEKPWDFPIIQNSCIATATASLTELPD